MKPSRLRDVVFSNVFYNLFPHCVALVSKLVWTLKPALKTHRMSSKLQTGEFSMSSWLFQFLAEIWTAKGLLFLVSSMVTSKRGVTGPKFPIASILSARGRRWNINKLHDLDAMRKRTCSTRLHYTISSSHWWQESVRCRHLTGWSFISFLLFEADKGPLYPTRKEAFFRRHMTVLCNRCNRI